MHEQYKFDRATELPKTPTNSRVCFKSRTFDIIQSGELQEFQEKGTGNKFKAIMAKNFANLEREDIQIQETQRIPNKQNSSGYTETH